MPIATAPVFAVFPALGSEVVVGVTDAALLEPAVDRVKLRLAEVDRALSRFRDDSELAAIDRAPERPHLVSPLFLEALELACRAAASTDGWFDPTVRDALEAAGYDRGIDQIETAGPGPARPALPAGQWRLIFFDHANRIVALPRGVRLDFGGIGKGFAVDYALRDFGETSAGVLISAGGDIGVAGPAPEGGWLCEVAQTREGEAETCVLLRSGALASSGLGRRQWQRDGERLHHLIDPRSGRPGASPWRLVTVAAPSCAAAEVAAKVAWLRGAAGLDWIDRLHLSARFAAVDGTVQVTGAWPVHAKED